MRLSLISTVDDSANSFENQLFGWANNHTNTYLPKC
jgi:hypothetical protein